MKFAIGDLVVEKTYVHPHTSYSVMKVIHILDGSYVVEHFGFAYDGEVQQEHGYESKPGTRSWREALQRYQEEELCSVKEAEEERHRRELIEDKLTQEFEDVRVQLHAKLDKAADLVREAHDLAKAKDKDLSDLIDECRPLLLALKNGGWTTSTMKCM